MWGKTSHTNDWSERLEIITGLKPLPRLPAQLQKKLQTVSNCVSKSGSHIHAAVVMEQLENFETIKPSFVEEV